MHPRLKQLRIEFENKRYAHVSDRLKERYHLEISLTEFLEINRRIGAGEGESRFQEKGDAIGVWLQYRDVWVYWLYLRQPRMIATVLPVPPTPKPAPRKEVDKSERAELEAEVIALRNLVFNLKGNPERMKQRELEARRCESLALEKCNSMQTRMRAYEIKYLELRDDLLKSHVHVENLHRTVTYLKLSMQRAEFLLTDNPLFHHGSEIWNRIRSILSAGSRLRKNAPAMEVLPDQEQRRFLYFSENERGVNENRDIW